MPVKIARSTRHDRVRALYRSDLLEAALDAFSEQGYRKTTMQAVADRAGLAVGSIYNIFPSKRALYEDLAGSLLRTARLTFEQVFEQDQNELATLQAYIHRKGEFFQQNVRMARLFFGEMRVNELAAGDGDRPLQELEEFVLAHLTSVFESGRVNGVFRFEEDDAFSLAFAVQRLTSAFMALWLRHPDRYPYPQSVAPVLDAILRGIVVGALWCPADGSPHRTVGK